MTDQSTPGTNPIFLSCPWEQSFDDNIYELIIMACDYVTVKCQHGFIGHLNGRGWLLEIYSVFYGEGMEGIRLRIDIRNCRRQKNVQIRTDIETRCVK